MADTNGKLQRVALLFDELADLPEQDRAARLGQLAVSEPEVEASVRRLLDADQQAMAAVEKLPLQPAASDPIRTFGQYRSVRQIGEGGMGAVYLAERSDGQFTRRAAIKVIQGSLANEEMRMRFLSERQILANLQHPGIASLLDGGVTPAGEPYLVMEYIEGLPLDGFCDQHRLTVEQRIDLFLKVCSAVDFAHRHLIIHRDLKPSNILVDHAGNAKLLDFGAAKLLGPVPVDRTRQFLTPRYASPEQMRGASAAVSMDVYALGVILYELLTGHWPFGDPSDMASNLRRATVGAEPAPPTVTRQAAEARSTSEHTLRKTLSGDLTAILSKALEFDVPRRYGTVAELAADVQRFRSGQPVLARPQTTAYKVRKWIGRNPLQSFAAGLAVAAILAGIGLREQQRLIAERRFDELRSLARYQIFDLQEQMYFYGSPLPVRKVMAERSMQALEQLSRESTPNFDLQADLTDGFTQLAELLGNPLRSNLGEPAQGRKALDRARQMNNLLQAMNGPNRIKQGAKARLELQEAMYDLGASRTRERLDRVRQSMEAWEAASDPASMSPRELARMANFYLILAVNQGQIHGVVDTYRKEESVLPHARRLVDLAQRKDPADPLLRFFGLHIAVTEAEELSNRDSNAGRNKLLELSNSIDNFDSAESSAERVRFLRARILGSLGWLEGQMKLYEPALNHLERCTTVWRQLVEGNPSQVNLRYELAGAYRDKGFVSGYAGKHNEAAFAMQDAISEYKRLQPGLYRRQIGELQVRLGAELNAAGRVDEARPAIRAGQDLLVELAARPDSNPRELMLAARYLIDVPLPDLRRPQLALDLAQRADKISPRDAMVIEILARAYAMNGRRQEALDAVAQFKSLVPPTSIVAQQQVEAIAREVDGILASTAPPPTQ
jgi:serine/threonine protein kinase/tetratricopeptide (TPR) repeat protein